jgi:hypothetical protein
MRRCSKWLALAALGVQLPLFAAECDFHTQGDPRNGLGLVASMPISNTTVSSALGQLRKAGRELNLSPGYDIIEGDKGQLYFLQKDSNPPIAVLSEVSNQRIVLVGKLPRGQKINQDATKTLMCGMLQTVQPGSKGEALASEARQADRAMFTPTNIDAVQLSKDMGKDGKRVTKGLTKGAGLAFYLFGPEAAADKVSRIDQAAVLLPFMATYLGRPYRVDGEIYTISVNRYAQGGPVVEVDFLVTKRKLIGGRQHDSSNFSEFGVKCIIARGQEPSVATLRNHDFATLTGTVSEVSPGGVTLGGCHP